MKILKKLSIMFVTMFLVVTPLALTTAQTVEAVEVNRFLCLGINLGDSDKCRRDDGSNLITDLGENIIGLLMLLIGIVSIIMIVVGGFKYVTSGGDSTKVTSAKNTILYAIIGLVIAILSSWIIEFVIGRFTDNS